MKKSISAALVALMLSSLAAQAASVSSLLIVPARQRMIQLAFDMQSLRKAEVVCWRVVGDPETPQLNYWTGEDWTPITLDEFRSHAKLPAKPEKVIFIGLDTPTVLTESFPGIARFETFDPAMLVNNLDAFYNFSNGEWRLLAKRYGFMLRDVNAKLRSRNRYEAPPPREPKSKRSPVIFDKNLPPAEVAEPTPAEEPIEAPKPVVEQAEPVKEETTPEIKTPVVEIPKEVTEPVNVEGGNEPPPAVVTSNLPPVNVESKPIETPSEK